MSSKSYIYCIKDKEDTSVLYIGSTTDVKKRIAKHKNSCFNESSTKYNYPIYKYIRSIGWNNIEFEVLLEFKVDGCFSKEIVEQFYINDFKPEYNEHLAYGFVRYTEEGVRKLQEYHREYYEQNKDKIKERTKQYRERNTEYYREYKKEYYDNNKEYFREKNKQYRENNKEYLREKNKEYRENNKEYLREQKRQYREKNRCPHSKEPKKCVDCRPWTCDVCQSTMSINSKNRHLKSKKHIKNLNKNID